MARPRPKTQGQPRHPAAVSGPGALSRRTDGGAGSRSQPIRTATGGDYGAAKASRDQQQAAPLAVAPEGPQSIPASPPSSGIPSGLLSGAFGPTERPNEPITTGLPPQARGQAPDVDAILRELYSKFPHPRLLNLIRRG